MKSLEINTSGRRRRVSIIVGRGEEDFRSDGEPKKEPIRKAYVKTLAIPFLPNEVFDIPLSETFVCADIPF